MMKTYRSLFTRAKSQDATTAFAYFYPINGEYDEPFRIIAKKTIDGFSAWGFTQERFKAKHCRSAVPKLRNYLDYTFVRLQDLELTTPGAYFRYDPSGEWVAFNTGLQNVYAVDLMAVFQRYRPREEGPVRAHTDWVFKGCFATNERGYRDHFGSSNPPEIAYYSVDSRDFVFNTMYHLEKDGFDHLLERGRERAGLPVTASDDANQVYTLKTIYDLDHAYFAARLITRPDQDWLNP